MENQTKESENIYAKNMGKIFVENPERRHYPDYLKKLAIKKIEVRKKLFQNKEFKKAGLDEV